MPRPAPQTAAIAAPQLETKQARLDAAIALFRSEASASGYVVEEVRLRLPVPDVDVTPRVVIAQQSASSGAPPTFPRAKHHRPLAMYPQPSSLPNDYPPVPILDATYANPTHASYRIPKQTLAESARLTQTSSNGAGFKRTVSGSVILHPLPPRTTTLHRDGTYSPQNATNAPKKTGHLGSNPYLPTKDGRHALQPHGQHFWKTVIGGEKGKQILQAAESMQRLRHASLEHSRQQVKTEAISKELSEPIKTRDLSDDEESSSKGKKVSPKNENDENDKRKKNNENTHHINGHDIPESDVQLLLSSVADISARERKLTQKAVDNPAQAATEENGKRNNIRPQAVVAGKPSGTKAIPVSSGRKYSSRGRRDGSERRSSSSAARPYKCTSENCTSSFDREGHLRVHILAVHEKKRPFVCQVCDASFGHSSSLLRHVRTVHQASPAVGSGKTHNFSRTTQNSDDSGTTKSELVCETLQDDSEKHFRCSVCRMAFNRVALLNRHVAEKHPLQTSLSDESKSKKSP